MLHGFRIHVRESSAVSSDWEDIEIRFEGEEEIVFIALGVFRVSPLLVVERTEDVLAAFNENECFRIVPESIVEDRLETCTFFRGRMQESEFFRWLVVEIVQVKQCEMIGGENFGILIELWCRCHELSQ